MVQLLDPKIDVIFKDFFGDINSKDILESFINAVLGLEGDDQIEVEAFLDPRKQRVDIGRPSTFVDLSVKTRKGERYIIEMQTYNHKGFDKRLLYYLGKDYTEQIDYIEEEKKRRLIDWQELPKVHIIAITDFHRSEKDQDGILNDQEVVETYTFSPEFSKLNAHIFNQWKATIVDLKKFGEKTLERLKTIKEKWFYLLKNASLLEENDTQTLKQEGVFKHALEKLERLSSDPKKRKAYEESINDLRNEQALLLSAEEKGLMRGLEEGQRKGLEAGLEKGKRQIASKMLQRGRPIEEIIEDTGLSTEEIQSLSV